MNRLKEEGKWDEFLAWNAANRVAWMNEHQFGAPKLFEDGSVDTGILPGMDGRFPTQMDAENFLNGTPTDYNKIRENERVQNELGQQNAQISSILMGSASGDFAIQAQKALNASLPWSASQDERRAFLQQYFATNRPVTNRALANAGRINNKPLTDEQRRAIFAKSRGAWTRAINVGGDPNKDFRYGGTGDLNKKPAPTPAPSQPQATLPSPVAAPAAKPNSMRFYQDPKTGKYIQIPLGYTIRDGNLISEADNAKIEALLGGATTQEIKDKDLIISLPWEPEPDYPRFLQGGSARAGVSGASRPQYNKVTGQMEYPDGRITTKPMPRDPGGMVYTGGTPNFDESTGRYKEESDHPRFLQGGNARAGVSGGGMQPDKENQQPNSDRQKTKAKIYTREDIAGLAYQPTDAILASSKYQQEKAMADALLSRTKRDGGDVKKLLRNNPWMSLYIRKSGKDNTLPRVVKPSPTAIIPAPTPNPPAIPVETPATEFESSQNSETVSGGEASPHWSVPGPVDPVLRKKVKKAEEAAATPIRQTGKSYKAIQMALNALKD